MVSPLPRSVQTSLDILNAHQVLGGKERSARMIEQRIGRVVEIFGEVGARWALVGAHAVGLVTEPRATVDFDFIVDAAKLRSVVERLEEELGELRVVDIGPALRLEGLGVDLIRSTTHPLFAEALNHVREEGGWLVPAHEILMALKFLAAVNPWRGLAKRAYDVGDLRALFQAVGGEGLDREWMSRLAAQVYPGAEAEFEDLLGRIERGEPISI